MMSRRFTNREKILLIALSILLLGLLYYQFVVKDVERTILEYDTTDLETDLLVEQTKASEIMRMEAEMKDSDVNESGYVATYNNVKNEINELNDIFSSATSYSFGFAEPVSDGNAVRRDISISFSARSYATAKTIIQRLNDCRYMCHIGNVSISSNADGGGVAAGAVSVSMNVTFFETTYNSDTTQGLQANEN